MNITIATEDELSEEVLSKLIYLYLPNATIHQKLRKGGNGYLKSKIESFNKIANRNLVFLLTDLDSCPCAPNLISNWFRNANQNDDLIFRVAVKEVEAWLLADHVGIKELLGSGGNAVPLFPDNLSDPKQYLLNRARNAPGDIRRDLIRIKSTSIFPGLGYNARLCEFVRTKWDPSAAADRSDSLQRTINRLIERR